MNELLEMAGAVDFAWNVVLSYRVAIYKRKRKKGT